MDKADRATMIPGDLAARLRLLTEASFFADEPPIGPLQRTRAIPEQLPEYRPGDRFSAQIQKALPDGTFEALVGVRRAIVHVYNSTSPAQRERVFGLDRAGVAEIARQGALWVQREAANQQCVRSGETLPSRCG